MEISKKVQELRKLHGHTQNDLADILNVPVRTLAGWERGERNFPLDIIIKLATTYHVSTDSLFGIDEQAYTEEQSENTIKIYNKDIQPNAKPEPMETIALPVNMEELVDLITKTVDQKTSHLATKDDVKNIIIQLLTDAANGG